MTSERERMNEVERMALLLRRAECHSAEDLVFCSGGAPPQPEAMVRFIDDHRAVKPGRVTRQARSRRGSAAERLRASSRPTASCDRR